jgi:putative ATP-dependent endonuclease of OLD family
MRLIELRVRNFRCLKNVILPIRELSVLIGENDAGKSSVLDLLDIVLNDRQPEDSDFYSFEEDCGGNIKQEDTIEAEFIFDNYPDEVISTDFLSEGRRLHLRKRYTRQSNETWYFGRCYGSAFFNQDLRSLKIPELDEVIEELEIHVEGRLNKDEKIQLILEYKSQAPFTQDWVSASPTAFREFLPRFERYRSIDYQDPTNIVFKTLRTVYETKIFEVDEAGQRQPIPTLSNLKAEIERELNNKVAELLDYVHRYNKKVRRIEFVPSIDFSSGLRSGQFSLDDGRGLHLLAKSGDGTKRRLLMSFFDWDREIVSQGQTRSLIRGYDEPDVNLHYEAQRHMYQTIRDVVCRSESHIQAIVCTHSLTMIDQASATSINLLRLGDCGETNVNYLLTDQDQEVEDFLANLAAELGITNSLLFYERCYVIIEGPTEENALPILYRRLYGQSLIEDGIRLINIEGNGGRAGLLKLLGKNRQRMTLALLDRDSKTSLDFAHAGFLPDRIEESLIYIGQKEFEDAFLDDVLCFCLNEVWPRCDGSVWQSEHINHLRENPERKFSDGLMGIIHQNSESATPNKKSIFGSELAKRCSQDKIPAEISILFERARQIASVA